MLTATPKLIKGGLVLVDPDSGQPLRIISLQYNPETLTRSLQVQGTENSAGDRSDALRLVGPPIETYKLDAEIDATDQLADPDSGSNATTVEFGIQPQLAVLETILYPTSDHLKQLDSMASSGSLEITPTQAPLTLFVWSKTRIVPVRITEFSIEEQFFDPNLNPIRAKVNLSMRVLSVNDLGFRHRGSSIYMLYQQQKEQLARKATQGSFSILGIGGIPS
ncbi:MAG: hypothetical protein WCI02_02740 [Planctomycetota bacterium]